MKKEKKDKKEEIKEEKIKKDPQDKVRDFFKELVPYIIIIFVVICIRTFITTPVRVNGTSMDPTFKEGEILLLNKMDKKYNRFDVVVADAADTTIIKRVVGLPGEKIAYKQCKLYINDEEIKDYVSGCITDDFDLDTIYGYMIIPKDHYFLMGDNRKDSLDSRDYRVGLVDKSQIKGKIYFRLTPFKRFGSIKK